MNKKNIGGSQKGEGDFVSATLFSGRLAGSGRDPARIDVFLDALRMAWMSAPDLRFFQLLSAIQPARSGVDTFYMEDPAVLAALQKFNGLRDTDAPASATTSG